MLKDKGSTSISSRSNNTTTNKEDIPSPLPILTDPTPTTVVATVSSSSRDVPTATTCVATASSSSRYGCVPHTPPDVVVIDDESNGDDEAMDNTADCDTTHTDNFLWFL
jgi:hypothetical protein